MEKDYWQSRWQNRSIEFDQKEPNLFLKEFFNDLKLKPHSTVFVPMCGKSVDMLWLMRQGYNLLGIELNLVACREFFEQNKLHYKESEKDNFHILTSENITLYSGDFFNFNKAMLGEIAAVYDRAALVALPETMRKQYVEHLKGMLTADVPVFLITAAYNQNEMNGPPFSVDKNEVEAHYGHDFKITQLHDEIAKELPPHLKAKGLKTYQHFVFILNKMQGK